MGNSSQEAAALVTLSNDLARAVEQAAGHVVAIHARERVPSSGIVWQPGVIVAADHTIRRREEIRVTLAQGHTIGAQFAGRDPGTDLAVLKIPADSSPPAPVGDSATLRTGHIVLSVARSGGEQLGATLGVISSLGGPWRTWRGGQLDQFVRLDMNIYLGFSGSALVDAQGRIVGMNTSGLARGLAMAVPAATVNRVAAELLTRGHVARGFLGVGMQPVLLPEALREKFMLAGNTGVIVVAVEPDSPAGRGGILLGDVLLAMEGAPVQDLDDVQSHLGPEKIGKEIAVAALRGGARVELNVTVGERPRGAR